LILSGTFVGRCALCLFQAEAAAMMLAFMLAQAHVARALGWQWFLAFIAHECT
jgi:hypothetical protein